MGTYRRKITIGAITALLAVTMTGFSNPAAAYAASDVSPDACRVAAEELLVENEQKTEDGFSFACMTGTVTATTDTSASTPEAQKSASPTRPTFSGEFSDPAKSEFRQAEVAADFCDYSGVPQRYILDELRSRVNFCIIYGQNNSPVNGSWSDSITMEWTLNLGWSAHVLQTRGSGTSGYATIDGLSEFVQFHGILPPTIPTASGWYFQMPSFSSSYTFPGYVQGTFTIQMTNMRVYDNSKAFNMDVAGAPVAFQRFLCNDYVQCRYPDGQEAPIF